MTFAVAPAAIVVDASVAVAFVMDEAWAGEAWASWIAEDRILVAPSLVELEVANALTTRRRVPAPEVAAYMADLREAELGTVSIDAAALEAAIRLAGRHGLTVYDATYLALAIELEADLATRDAALARAAEAEGVVLAIP